MSAPPPAGSPLLRLALEGERVRRAAKILERESPRLATGLRRAVPFLARRGVAINLSFARATPVAELLASLPRPYHATQFIAKPGRSAGALVLDADAVALFLDGVLGGDGAVLPTLNPAGLSAAQKALVGGLASNIVKAFSSALRDAIGVELEACEATIEEARSESAPIVCLIELGEGGRGGKVALLLAKESLLSGETTGDDAVPARGDARVATILQGVELNVVAELGRISLSVGAIAALRVGDTLRLDVPVTGSVSVRVNGQPLLRGRPTTNGGRIAIKVVGGHEG